MPRAMKLVFKELTASDFYWINQTGLQGGGGQSYIDFDTSDVSPAEWSAFFAGAAKGNGASGPYWTFTVRNFGANTTQANVKLGQRRATSFSIRSQKLPEHSLGGRRLHAWSPNYTAFPAIPAGLHGAHEVPFALIAELRIFLIRDDEGHYWAGWTRMLPPDVTDPRLIQMFERKSGMINLGGDYEIDPTSPNWPLSKTAAQSGQGVNAVAASSTNSVQSPTSAFAAAETEVGLPDDDSLWDPKDELNIPETGISYSVQQVRKRNQGAARAVRKLYHGCQITGPAFVFLTSKGKPYLEVHHLVPLGKGGADSPHNMIVVSAQAHKMLHHANVSPIDLSKIENNQLHITINGLPATITWHPQHAELVLAKNPPLSA